MTTADDNNTQEASSAQRMVGDEPQARNIDLGKSAITPLIRVSSAALYREDWWGRRWDGRLLRQDALFFQWLFDFQNRADRARNAKVSD